jgi:KRAB domain-containing zinc finger protein
MRTHTGEKPFRCKHCPRTFKKNSHRERHEFIHTGAKPYACGQCDKAYTRPGDLKVHLR